MKEVRVKDSIEAHVKRDSKEPITLEDIRLFERSFMSSCSLRKQFCWGTAVVTHLLQKAFFFYDNTNEIKVNSTRLKEHSQRQIQAERIN